MICKIEDDLTEEHKLVLTINRQSIVQWFKEQWDKLQQKLRNSVQREQKTEDSECNLIVFDWISIKLRIFASGWRQLCPDILEFRRSVMLIL